MAEISRKQMNRFLIAACLGMMLVGLAAGFSVPLERKTHHRDRLREHLFEYVLNSSPPSSFSLRSRLVFFFSSSFLIRKFQWPDGQKLPLVHTRHPETGRVVVQVPLLGDSVTLGELYMDLPIGSPPANYSAQVDTGSADLGIPDNLCTTCGKVAGVYVGCCILIL